jgi:hypothetical protein
MAGDRKRRIGENEILYRAVNEEIRTLDERLGAAAAPSAWFVCECGHADCAERIEMTRDEYRRLRSDPTTFAIVDGHEEPEAEHVIERTNRYTVVRKDPGEPARLATRGSD